MFNLSKYSKVNTAGLESDGLFIFKNWKNGQVTDNLTTIANNLDLPEFQKFIFENLTNLFEFELDTTIYMNASIEKMIKYNLINIPNIQNYCRQTGDVPSLQYQKFISCLFIYIIQKMNSIDIFNKYVELLQFDPDFVLKNYEIIKNREYLTVDNVDFIFSRFSIARRDKTSFQLQPNTHLLLYIEIMRQFNKKGKLVSVNKYLTESPIKTEQDFKLHKYWSEFTPDYKEIFYKKISLWSYSYCSSDSWSERRDLKDRFLTTNLEPEDYYSYCAKYNRLIFNYQMVEKILKNQENIETKLNKIMNKLGIDE